MALHGAALWRQVSKVVELKKNFRAACDPKFVNLLSRIRSGIAWNGEGTLSLQQKGTGDNYSLSDYEILSNRLLQRIGNDSEALERFKDAPIIVSHKTTRDAINIRKVKAFAESQQQEFCWYHSRDRYRRQNVPEDQQCLIWTLRSSVTKDALGLLPLVPGMKVMVTENVAIKANVVNGAEGVLMDIKYETDQFGRRYAVCAYVHIQGSNMQAPGLPYEVVPILPVSTSFRYTQAGGLCFNISRWQLPLLPAYAYTDYKSQGRSLDNVIIDLTHCYSLQSAYVMLSRARSLEGLAILRPFNPRKINQRLPEEFRNEFARLNTLNVHTLVEYEASQ